MKKYVLLLNLVFLFSLNAFAQNPNFSAEWMLDKEKSKLDERLSASIESQSLKVEQGDKNIKVTVTTKSSGNQGGVDIGGGTNTYPLDGKEFNSETETQIGRVFLTFKGEIKDGKLHLQSVRKFNTPNGEVTLMTKEVWDLSADGKTLTIKRESEAQRGKVSSELVFTKKT